MFSVLLDADDCSGGGRTLLLDTALAFARGAGDAREELTRSLVSLVLLWCESDPFGELDLDLLRRTEGEWLLDRRPLGESCSDRSVLLQRERLDLDRFRAGRRLPTSDTPLTLTRGGLSERLLSEFLLDRGLPDICLERGDCERELPECGDTPVATPTAVAFEVALGAASLLDLLEASDTDSTEFGAGAFAASGPELATAGLVDADIVAASLAEEAGCPAVLASLLSAGASGVARLAGGLMLSLAADTSLS